MKKLLFSCYCLFSILFISCSSGNKFVQVKNGQFMIENKPYYYIGTNFWYGAILASEGEGGNRERLHKELDFMKNNGITNLRILVGADGESRMNKVEPALQLAPGVYNDTILDGLDYLLSEMDKRNMHAVLYLNNAWEWSGGYSQYLEWAGKGKAPVPSVDGWSVFMDYVQQFVVNDSCKQLFKNHVEYIINRTNRYTKLKYTEDPTIMSWQIANEPRAFSTEYKEAFAQWVIDVATFIKSMDKNHLVSTGSEGMAGCEGDIELWKRIHADTHIDYMNIHIWPNNWGWIDRNDQASSVEKAKTNTLAYIEKHVAIAKEYHKPIVLEEFGYPRDNYAFQLGSPTTYRDAYYETIFKLIAANKKEKGVFAGCNFWAWGGFGKPSTTHTFWTKGDDYVGDPAQEEQGLNSVFNTDTTIELIKKYTGDLQKSKNY